MTVNYTVIPDLPPLPEYTLRPVTPLISWLPEAYLTLVAPVVAYWVVSLLFHLIDTYDLFPQYRLHTPVELLKRNHATRWDVLRDVIIQQVIQTVSGFGLSYFDEEQMCGKEDYDVAVWAQRLRLAQRAVPSILGLLGVDAVSLASHVSATHPMVAGVLAGGRYPGLSSLATVGGDVVSVPAFAGWEILVAKAIYYLADPAIRFGIAIAIIDTWQYFLHRGMHMNKWLYTTFHARHHRLYVPYAYGALYNHPVEGFVLDTVGALAAYLITGLTNRQAMVLFTGSTIKTVDDHCGYALPFDPLQFITTNNAAYHDIHHQSWGIKTNFSQPFFTFWDRFLQTKWTGDVSTRYERDRKAAQRHMDREQNEKVKSKELEEILKPSIPEQAKVKDLSMPAPSPVALRKSPRKKSTSISQQSAASLKGLRDRVNQNLQGAGGNIIGVDGRH